ncbi:MAG: hypothetical protein ABIH52_02725 [Candidatus Aenigmatarchaeota archaeon]|nr:hypothetical protein [Nanoarchaeota archaeon]
MKWGEDDIKFLRENYGKMPTREIASKLGAKVSDVNSKAWDLDLKTPNSVERWRKTRKKQKT